MIVTLLLKMSSLLVSLLLLGLLAGVSPYSIFPRQYDEESDTPPSNNLDQDEIHNPVEEYNADMKPYPWELCALFEGDIMLPQQGVSARNLLRDKNSRWPGGVVPYQINSVFGETQKEMIREAMRSIEEISCVRFRPREERDQDYIQIEGEGDGCFSDVGRIGGNQTLNLENPACLGQRAIVHELLHALGFEHQQSASNRDQYVKIHWDNIQEDEKCNFVKYNSNILTDFGLPYDYESIMQYSSDAFSHNNKPTITSLDGGLFGDITKMSKIDIKKLNIMYDCESNSFEEDSKVKTDDDKKDEDSSCEE